MFYLGSVESFKEEYMLFVGVQVFTIVETHPSKGFEGSKIRLGNHFKNLYMLLFDFSILLLFTLIVCFSYCFVHSKCLIICPIQSICI